MNCEPGDRARAASSGAAVRGGTARTLAVREVVAQVRAGGGHGLAVAEHADVVPHHFRVAEGRPAVAAGLGLPLLEGAAARGDEERAACANRAAGPRGGRAASERQRSLPWHCSEPRLRATYLGPCCCVELAMLLLTARRRSPGSAAHQSRCRRRWSPWSGPPL